MTGSLTDETQLELQAYLDGELDPSRKDAITALLASNAEAQALLRELETTRGWLAGNEPELALPESREFYWSKIAHELDRQPGARAHAERRRPLSWLGWLVPVGAAATLVLLLIGSGQLDGTIPQSVQVVEAPSEDISVITFRSDTEGLSIVWISTD